MIKIISFFSLWLTIFTSSSKVPARAKTDVVSGSSWRTGTSIQARAGTTTNLVRWYISQLKNIQIQQSLITTITSPTHSK